MKVSRISRMWKINGMIPLQYRHLFYMNSDLLEPTIDKSEYLVNLPVTPEFEALVTMIGKKIFGIGLYSKIYSLGCITVSTDPIFARIPQTKIHINPSNCGFKVYQIFQWINFIVGVGHLHATKVKRVEYKIDVHHLDTEKCIKKLWCSRKFISIFRIPGFLLIGGKQSKIKRKVYDKSKHLAKLGIYLGYPLTRIEIIQSFEPAKQVSVVKFFKDLPLYNPFDELYMLLPDLSTVYLMIKKSFSNDTILIDLLRSLTSYRRQQIVQQLVNSGALQSFDTTYEQQRNRWLSNSAKHRRPKIIIRSRHNYYYSVP